MRLATLVSSLILSLPVYAAELDDGNFLPDTDALTASDGNPQEVVETTPELTPAVVTDADAGHVVHAADMGTTTVSASSSLLMGETTLHTSDELFSLLERAERIAAGEDEYSTTEPVVLVLNGEEIDLFKRENYRSNKSLIDLAARLEAFNVVDIKVCKYWMYQRGIDIRDLPPFIDTVHRAQSEKNRLKQAGYVSF